VWSINPSSRLVSVMRALKLLTGTGRRVRLLSDKCSAKCLSDCARITSRVVGKQEVMSRLPVIRQQSEPRREGAVKRC
jgi:hypothetical protein